jgi:hypothetical protein
MSRRALAATLMTVGLASFCLLPFGGKPTDAQALPPTQSPVGRYQVSGDGPRSFFIVDTTNGRCWRGTISDGPTRWDDLGSPIDHPTAK